VNPLGTHPESFAKGWLFSFPGGVWFCLCRGMAACALFASRMSTRGCARYNAARPHVIIPSEAAFRRRSPPAVRLGPAVCFASVPVPFFYVVIPNRAVCGRPEGPAVCFASVPLPFFFMLSSRAAPSADALRDRCFLRLVPPPFSFTLSSRTALSANALRDLLFLCQRISTQPNLLQPSIVFRSAGLPAG
jgi:hypothetical protein